MVKLDKRQVVFFFLFVFFAIMFVQAQDLSTALGATGIEKTIKAIADVMKGPIATAVLILVVCVIGYILIVNQDNQSVKKKAIAALVGLAVVRGASELAAFLTAGN